MTKTEIKKNRKAKGLTQTALAILLGVSVDAVRKWEQGVTTPNLANVQKLQEVFNG
jgi:DNA-binding transcriptional regulator YiaG